VTDVIVEVGPGTIRGPNDARADWVSAALECIDDTIALVDDRPVYVAEVWRSVLGEVIGRSAATVVLVIPSWWTSTRIDLVRGAANDAAVKIVVLQRTVILREGVSSRPVTVAEVAGDFVVVSPPAAEPIVVPRRDGQDDVAIAVARQVGTSTAVLVDAPAEVDGAILLGLAIAERLRADSIDVTIADRDWVPRMAAIVWARGQDGQSDLDGVDGTPLVRRRRTAMVVGALVSAAALSGALVVRHAPTPPTEDVPTTLLVEGRVGVMVPAQWAVQRITSGPGSARVQIVSPWDRDVAIHITQSPLASHQTQEKAADALSDALSEQPAGIFVDFEPTGFAAGRPAVTYREVRGDRHIAWAVVIDATLRIAIGCQSMPGREPLMRAACDQAIQTAHAVY
jgi:type VII secretion-associated protein (TIGR03931 family)